MSHDRDHTTPACADRRAFLRSGAAAGGGLLLSLVLSPASAAGTGSDGATAASRARAGAVPPDLDNGFRPNAFIELHRDGRVTLVMPKAEMGQAIHTAFAQLLAEELALPLDRLRIVDAPADDNRYGDALFGGLQMTGGSTSVRGSWMRLREAGATARTLLVQVAADRWQVAPAGLVARDGRVVDLRGRRSLAYAELLDAAARLPVPTAVVLTPAAEFRVIGQPVRRLDGRSKVDGSARFGIDARPPGVRVATVAACPVFGGTLAGADDTAALTLPGVRQVVRLPHALAVVGDHYWAARQGLLAAAPRWNEGPHASVDSALLMAQLDTAARGPGAVAAHSGDPGSALAGAAQRHGAVYRAPLLAHATLEPMNCTVDVRPGSVELWVGTQVPTLAQAVAAKVAGVPPERVTVHNHTLGGGFGRRLEVDFIEQAVAIARQVSGPVKVVWSREEDIQHDMYRPIYHDTVAAGLDGQGRPVAWTHRIAASSIIARFFPPLFKDGVDADAVEGARESLYAIPARHVDYLRVEPAAVPTAFWRGVGPTHNGFVVEGFIDELAHLAGQDPLDYRRSLLRDPRARGVLDLAARRAGWGQPLPAGQGRGIALLHAFGSYVAQVAQVSVDASGEVAVTRVVCAVDCGLPVNPSSIAAQMEGGIVFGLSAALWGEVTIAQGRVQQSNFHDVRLMRMNEAPRIEVHIVPSDAPPGGVGEPGTSAAMPAVVNAVFAATGRRIRRLPIGSQLAAAG